MGQNLFNDLGLAELLNDDANLFDVEDILDSVNVPLINPWDFSARADEPPPLPTKRRSRLRSAIAMIVNIVIYAVCIAVIAMSVILKFSGDNDSIFGYHIYNVETGSMTPTVQPDGTTPKGGFRKNDAIIVKNAAAEEVIAGDIITFWTSELRLGETVTHRVIEVQNNGGSEIFFRTKGDHNSAEDPWLTPGDHLVGIKVLSLPKVGGILIKAKAHPVITIGISGSVMVAVFALFFVFSRHSARKDSFK